MYKSFNTIILRTPAYPYRYGQDFLYSNKKLEIFKNKFVQEAIYIASPVLYRELLKMLAGEIKELEEVNRIEYSLTRYMSRMSTRCTPFGLFAGCSLLSCGENTDIKMNTDIYVRKTRLDMFLLNTIYEELVKIPDFKNKLRYHPNTTLYPIGKKLRYVEYICFGLRKKYQIMEIDRNTYLEKILRLANDGATIRELVQQITDEDISEEDANEYIHELIDNQILMGELNLSVTGDDFLTRLKQLAADAGIEKMQQELKHIESILDEKDVFLQPSIKSYEKVINHLSNFNIQYDEKYLFQVDMMKNLERKELGIDILNEVESGMSFLNKLFPLVNNNQTYLNQFKNEFFNRYEEREIPLLEVLDPELGIGYPPKVNKDISPLVDDIVLPQRKSGPITKSFTSVERMLFKKLTNCVNNNRMEIELTDSDMKDNKVKWNDFSDTIHTMFSIIKKNDREVLLHIHYIHNGGARLLARFAHVDKKLEAFINEISQKEQELSEDILAEFVYSPEKRMGNILFRPHIREYELLYMGSTDLPEEQLIRMDDLYISIRNQELKIRSKRLNRYIVPCLTTAHNYVDNALPAYHFFGDFQNAKNNLGGLFFKWGSLEGEFHFFPRIKYRNIILSLARWDINIKELGKMFQCKIDSELILLVTEWREKKSIPRFTTMPDGDNVLYTDWNSVLSIRSLFGIIKNRSTIKLEEFLFDEVNNPVKMDNNSCLNEFIAVFYKEKR